MLGCVVAVAARLITARDTPSTRSSGSVGGGLKATAEAGVPGATAGSSLSKFMIELIVEAHHHAVYSSCGLDKLKIAARGCYVI